MVGRFQFDRARDTATCSPRAPRCPPLTRSPSWRPRLGNFNPLYSFIYIKSDRWGALNWGLLTPASDNPAVLADISGTVIESTAVFFEGASFFLRPKGGNGGGFAACPGLQWEDFLQCQGLGLGIGADCFGAASRRFARLADLGRLPLRDLVGQADPASGVQRSPRPKPISGTSRRSTRLTGIRIKLSAAYASHLAGERDQLWFPYSGVLQRLYWRLHRGPELA